MAFLPLLAPKRFHWLHDSGIKTHNNLFICTYIYIYLYMLHIHSTHVYHVVCRCKYAYVSCVYILVYREREREQNKTPFPDRALYSNHLWSKYPAPTQDSGSNRSGSRVLTLQPQHPGILDQRINDYRYGVPYNYWPVESWRKGCFRLASLPWGFQVPEI